jgi:hypothetical protein
MAHVQALTILQDQVIRGVLAEHLDTKDNIVLSWTAKVVPISVSTREVSMAKTTHEKYVETYTRLRNDKRRIKETLSHVELLLLQCGSELGRLEQDSQESKRELEEARHMLTKFRFSADTHYLKKVIKTLDKFQFKWDSRVEVGCQNRGGGDGFNPDEWTPGDPFTCRCPGDTGPIDGKFVEYTPSHVLILDIDGEARRLPRGDFWIDQV